MNDGEDIQMRADSAEESAEAEKQLPAVKNRQPKEDAWSEHGAGWRYLGNGAYMRCKFSC